MTSLLRTSATVAPSIRAATFSTSKRGYAEKYADSTQYHLAPKGFWKKFRDAVVVNPDISTGLPLVAVNRNPAPGSRPEKYATPATLASDPAQNPYWKRDVRRAYPRLSVVDQSELAQLLLASPDVQSSSKEVTAFSGTPELTQVISAVASSKPAFSGANLPPRPPSIGKWNPKLEAKAPHDPQAYWPMEQYS
ncbi:hypothetical protein FRB94_012063 [Tulasnella sp. JGI-2019a]|nr:hypothetical protein FRB94_012063 [Tulasnella sp. JGI-2019a]KAG9014547.1 hypothetical protein FRB93_013672 [Tulasnella sp. JGI-2019a]KAG9039801.1 hypothetical protein FRB95_007228 [Tulasnella sp. JGI-2019a]